jgi:hypothetical protein
LDTNISGFSGTLESSNLIVSQTIASLNEAVKELSKDEKVKVVIFTIDVAGYFFNHLILINFQLL